MLVITITLCTQPCHTHGAKQCALTAAADATGVDTVVVDVSLLFSVLFTARESCNIEQ